ncbi:hypothetical protein [Arthrobacter pascens]|uniref:hypothetical protein n=1 Tax=Arthrobacter pascens TaxID=1677 RepID=UPI00196AB4EB|nr:hypothetical protein [Arthrobacter pascens]MBN3497866.1 hypothetical protein [Arthrobacter pascens]
MIKKLIPAILAVALLCGCSTPTRSATASPSPTESAEAETAAPEAIAAPETTEASSVDLPPAATTLAESLETAKQDHESKLLALAAMIDLQIQAKSELKPAMPEDKWIDLELLRINTILGAKNDSMTEREVFLAVRQYTAAIELEAISQGKA